MFSRSTPARARILDPQPHLLRTEVAPLPRLPAESAVLVAAEPGPHEPGVFHTRNHLPEELERDVERESSKRPGCSASRLPALAGHGDLEAPTQDFQGPAHTLIAGTMPHRGVRARPFGIPLNVQDVVTPPFRLAQGQGEGSVLDAHVHQLERELGERDGQLGSLDQGARDVATDLLRPIVGRIGIAEADGLGHGAGILAALPKPG